MYKKVELREKWVKMIDANTFRGKFTDEETQEIIEWCENTEIGTAQLDEALCNDHWRKKKN